MCAASLFEACPSRAIRVASCLASCFRPWSPRAIRNVSCLVSRFDADLEDWLSRARWRASRTRSCLLWRVCSGAAGIVAWSVAFKFCASSSAAGARLARSSSLCCSCSCSTLANRSKVETRGAAHAVPRGQLFERIVRHAWRITALEKQPELAAAEQASLLACRWCLVTIAANVRRRNPAARMILPGRTKRRRTGQSNN